MSKLSNESLKFSPASVAAESFFPWMSNSLIPCLDLKRFNQLVDALNLVLNLVSCSFPVLVHKSKGHLLVAFTTYLH